jgi:enterochelin esterase-like enzyme
VSQSLGNWSEVAVAGHPCDVFEPARPSEHGYVVLYLHGIHLDRLHDNATFTELFARYGLRAICPLTQRSWWTDRICQEFDPRLTAARHVLDNVVPYIAERWGTRPPQIALLGTSMGGQGALKFSFLHPNTFPIVAAISPAIDYQIRFKDRDVTLPLMYADAEAARQDTATLHVHPLNWPRNLWFCCDPTDYRWIDSSERLRMKLYSLGIPHECQLETTAGGHGWQYYNHMAPAAIGFIAEKLERERLRVV